MNGRNLLVSVLLHVLFCLTKSQSGGGDDFGISLFNNLAENSPEKLCEYITCHESIDPDDCPQDTVYTEGVTQFGCCGGCVAFKKQNEEFCTGSIDPMFGGGYDPFDQQNETLRSCTVEIESKMKGLPVNNNIVYSSWCNYNLECSKENIRKCGTVPELKGCLNIQKAFDDAVANPAEVPEDLTSDYIFFRDDYRWRPDCTPTGEYVEKQCKGPSGEKRCVCVDPFGNRIYGSAFSIQPDLFNTMNCKCSREVWERKQAGALPVTLHCAENGNYDELQCENDWCYCIHPINATTYGPSLPESSMHLLPCYNKTTVGQQYLRRCESERYAHDVLSDVMMGKGVHPPSSSIDCDEDGSYSPLQNKGSGFQCVDKYNAFIFSPAEGRCECKRDENMFTELEQPQELTCNFTNGRYEDIQVKSGTAFCNDYDGIRSGPLVYSSYVSNLDCTNAFLCQNGNQDACSSTCKNCPPEAYVKYR